jgi:soluble lytic murein transglycosylase-like protein
VTWTAFPRLYANRGHLLPALLAFCLLAAPSSLPASTQQPPDPELRKVLSDAIATADTFEDQFAAEVWLVDMSTRLQNKVPDPAERIQILKAVHIEATRARLPPELVLAIIEVESNFDRFAISEAGARGLMQVMPFWLEEIGRPDDNLFHIRTNLRFGCQILSYYLKQEGGSKTRALARYNGSVGKTWYPRRVFSAWNKRWYRQ